MNEKLSSPALDACLEVLARGLVQIRMAVQSSEHERAEAIADALHNLPHLLVDGDRRGWTIAEFRQLFLADLSHQYPDLAGLDQLLQVVE